MMNGDHYFTFGYKVANELMKMCLQPSAQCFHLLSVNMPLLSLKPLLIMELGHGNVVASCTGDVYLTITQHLHLVLKIFA